MKQIDEIGYADAMPDVQSQFDWANATALNPNHPYDGQTIYAVPGMGFLFVFIKNPQHNVGAYIVIDQHQSGGSFRLHRLRNTGSTPGAVTLLVRFVTKESGMKIRIDRTENLTRDGFDWLERLIKNPRGFTITDQNGNMPEPVALKQEWEQAKETKKSGPTAIFIESHWPKREQNELIENQSRLIPMWTHGLGDPELI